MGDWHRPIGISDLNISSISWSIAGSELTGGGDNGADWGVAMLILPWKLCSTIMAVLLVRTEVLSEQKWIPYQLGDSLRRF
jgi:hypothetical protein